MQRIALRALGLTVVIPTLLVIFIFRDQIPGKETPLLLILLLALLGFHLVWGVLRSFGDFQKGLEKVARGEADSVDVDTAPEQMREMGEIINSLNRLTIEFRENAAQLERFMDQFATLAELTEITAKVPEIDELLDLVLEKAMSSTGARNGSTLLLREDGEGFDTVCARGSDRDDPSQAAIDERLAKLVCDTGNALLVRDTSESPEVLQAIGETNENGSSSTAEHPQSVLVMPLKTKSGTVGSLRLSGKTSGKPFKEHDKQFLTVVLGQIGFAVENARLLKHAREAAVNLKQTVQDQEVQIQDAQEAILQAEKLSSLGSLAGGIAHDFNNLLQAILGYTAFAQKANTNADADALRNDLEQIRTAASRAANLTQDLLAFGRRQVLRTRDVDANEATESLISMLQRVIGAQIEIDFANCDAQSTINADPVQLEQVLMNLCLNARDAMPEGGTISVKIENVRLAEQFCLQHPWASPGDYVCLSVSDTGCGMDADTMAKIFDPFFTTKEVGKGTGLGLATCYGIVKQHDGLIHVESEAGIGTAFRTYWPRVDRPAAIVESPGRVGSLRGTETVLVAEDEEILRNLIARILTDSGYEVVTAKNGEEAMREFEAQPSTIDLALIDIVMPRMSGTEVCRKIREQRPEVGLLVCTGYTGKTIDMQFLHTEEIQIMQKPIDADALLQRVRDVLDAGEVAA